MAKAGNGGIYRLFGCKKCACLQQRKYYQLNKEKCLLADKIYRKNNMDRIKQQKRKYYFRNKEKIIKNIRRWELNNTERVKDLKYKWAKNNKNKILTRAKEAVERMDDYYIKRLLAMGTNWKSANIPQEMIELQRCSLILTRTKREMKNV